MIIPTEKTIFSVSQLNRRAKQLLETHLPLIWVSGELSNLAQPGSGHWYFSLKDDRAQVKCAMFKNANQRLRWRPEAGKQVLIRARVSLYEGRGDYQLIVEHMEESGAGALQQAYEALKLKLHQEGLFDDANKQELPLFPKHIGIITSPTGAAIRDILTVLQRRYPIAPVTVIPVAVQGEKAAPEMAAALNKAQHFKQFDIIIIGRGGGSIEDLWAFNNEELARTIAASKIPVISAVGHEVDFTICDLVADMRAPTPSASAEIATPDLEEWEQALDVWQQQLIRRQQAVVQQKQQQLSFLQKRLRHPGERISQQQQQLQQLESRFIRSIMTQISRKQQQLDLQHQRHHHQHPRTTLRNLSEKLVQLHRRYQQAIEHNISNKAQRLAASAQLLQAVSPLEILGRGYSIVSNESGSIIRNSKGLKTGDSVSTRLAKGSFTSTITKISDE